MDGGGAEIEGNTVTSCLRADAYAFTGLDLLGFTQDSMSEVAASESSTKHIS